MVFACSDSTNHNSGDDIDAEAGAGAKWTKCAWAVDDVSKGTFGNAKSLACLVI